MPAKKVNKKTKHIISKIPKIPNIDKIMKTPYPHAMNRLLCLSDWYLRLSIEDAAQLRAYVTELHDNYISNQKILTLVQKYLEAAPNCEIDRNNLIALIKHIEG